MAELALVAEDDLKQAELVRLYLQRDGFEVEVVHDGPSALAAAARRPPDIAVLDVMLPQLDGLEVCRRLGEQYSIPVVLLTARSTESDLVMGLYLGADDYVTKPYSPRELVARVRAVLRRARRAPTNPSAELVVGELVVRPLQHEVLVRQSRVDLTPVEFGIVRVLAEHRNQVVSRRQLLEHLYGGADYLTERTVDSHVVNVRRKIEADPRRPTQLLTVYGVGYKLVDPGPPRE